MAWLSPGCDENGRRGIQVLGVAPKSLVTKSSWVPPESASQVLMASMDSTARNELIEGVYISREGTPMQVLRYEYICNMPANGVDMKMLPSAAHQAINHDLVESYNANPPLFQNFTLKRSLVLKYSPYLKKMNGTGTIASPMKARTVLPQPSPRF